MQLSTGFALAIFLVLITGGGAALLEFLQVERGKGAALFLALAILSTLCLQWGGLSIHPASLLFYLAALILAHRRGEVRLSLFTAALGGVGGFFLLCLFREVGETGLLLSIPGLLLSILPVGSRQGGLLGACLSPFVAGLWLSIEEICLFERFYLELGSRTQLDGALAILLVFGFCRGIFVRFFPGIEGLFPKVLKRGETD